MKLRVQLLSLFLVICFSVSFISTALAEELSTDLNLGSSPTSYVIVPAGNLDLSNLTLNGIRYQPDITSNGDIIMRTRELQQADAIIRAQQALGLPLEDFTIKPDGFQIVPSDTITVELLQEFAGLLRKMLSSPEAQAIDQKHGITDFLSGSTTDQSASTLTETNEYILKTSFDIFKDIVDLTAGGQRTEEDRQTCEKAVSTFILRFSTMPNDDSTEHQQYIKDMLALFESNPRYNEMYKILEKGDYSDFFHSNNVVAEQTVRMLTAPANNLLGNEYVISDGSNLIRTTVSNIWQSLLTVGSAYPCVGCGSNPCQCQVVQPESTPTLVPIKTNEGPEGAD